MCDTDYSYTDNECSSDMPEKKENCISDTDEASVTVNGPAEFGFQDDSALSTEIGKESLVVQDKTENSVESPQSIDGNDYMANGIEADGASNVSGSESPSKLLPSNTEERNLSSEKLENKEEKYNECDLNDTVCCLKLHVDGIPENNCDDSVGVNTNSLELGSDSGNSDSVELGSDYVAVGYDPVELASESDEVGSDPVELASESDEIGSEPVELASESVEVGSDPVELASESVEIGSDPVELASESVEVGSDPVELASESVEVGSEPVELASESVEVGSDPVELASESVEIGSDPVDLASESVEVGSDPVELASESVEVGSDPVELASKSVEVRSDPVELASESVEVGSDSVKSLASESVVVESDPVELASETVEVGSDPVELASESVEVGTDPVELASESVEVGSDSVKLASESVGSDSTAVGSDSVRVESDSIRVGSGFTEVRSDSVTDESVSVKVGSNSVHAEHDDSFKVGSDSVKVRSDSMQVEEVKFNSMSKLKEEQSFSPPDTRQAKLNAIIVTAEVHCDPSSIIPTSTNAVDLDIPSSNIPLSEVEDSPGNVTAIPEAEDQLSSSTYYVLLSDVGNDNLREIKLNGDSMHSKESEQASLEEFESKMGDENSCSADEHSVVFDQDVHLSLEDIRKTDLRNSDLLVESILNDSDDENVIGMRKSWSEMGGHLNSPFTSVHPRSPSASFSMPGLITGKASSLASGLANDVDLDSEGPGFVEISLQSSGNQETRTESQASDETVPKSSRLANFLSRNLFGKKSKDTGEIVEQSAPGWKLFGKVPPKQAPENKINEFLHELKLTKVNSKPHVAVESHVRKSDMEVPSTTALILQRRPSGLPSKDPQEEMKHQMMYEEMIEAARKKEQKDAKLRKKQREQQLKHEEELSIAVRVWNKEILPNWETVKSAKKTQELWWNGIPPSIRGKIWKLAIGNDLNVTSELYEICLVRAKDKLKIMHDADTDSLSSYNDSSSNRESSVDLIKFDVSRTFPSLCIFQKGGPYHMLLQGLLGAYACYRPDVGYVQGMSFLAAVLLLNMDVVDTFICFANLLNKPCEVAFFRLDENLMKAYFDTYQVFFKENLRQLYNHFEVQNITPNLYIVKWMYTLFAVSLPLDVASRVWDVFCRDGEEFLFRTALGLLKLYEDILIRLDFIHLAEFLTQLPENISCVELFHCISQIRMQVDKCSFTQVLSKMRDLAYQASQSQASSASQANQSQAGFSNQASQSQAIQSTHVQQGSSDSQS